MDPNVCFSELTEALKTGDREESIQLLDNLRDWLSRGGFFPGEDVALALSDEEYVSNAGSICPFCKSSDITYTGKPEFMDDGGTNDIQCGSCNKEWTDQYQLVGYASLNGDPIEGKPEPDTAEKVPDEVMRVMAALSSRLTEQDIHEFLDNCVRDYADTLAEQTNNGGILKQLMFVHNCVGVGLPTALEGAGLPEDMREPIREAFRGPGARWFKVLDCGKPMGRDFTGMKLRLEMLRPTAVANSIRLFQPAFDNNGRPCSGFYTTTLDKVEEVL